MNEPSPTFFDRFHPIVIRQLRRLVRSHLMLISTIALYATTIAVFGLCFMYLGVRSSNANSAAYWSAAAVGPATIFMYIATIAAAAMLPASTIADELFDKSFTVRQRLHGYVFTGIVLSCYYASLALPFVSLAFVFGGTLLTSLFSLFSGIVTGICTTLFFLSFLAKNRSLFGIFFESVVLTFFSSILLGSYSLVETAIMISQGPGFLLGTTPPSGRIAPLNPNSIVFYTFAYGQWFVFGLVAYRLCRSHLSKPKRPMWLDHVINILVYVLLSTLFAGIWAALRFGGVI